VSTRHPAIQLTLLLLTTLIAKTAMKKIVRKMMRRMKATLSKHKRRKDNNL